MNTITLKSRYVVGLVALVVVLVVGFYAGRIIPSVAIPTNTNSPVAMPVPGTINETGLSLSNQGLRNLPVYVLNLKQLEALDISNNQLTGALPAEIRFLQNLKTLNVSRNNMTGIPAEIGQLSKLEVLDYSYNQITGLPKEIANLKNLKTLNLTGNNFSVEDLAGIQKQLPNLQVIK